MGACEFAAGEVMTRVLVYGTQTCPYCRMAEQLLRQKGVVAEYVRVDTDRERRVEMTRRSGRTSVPQIFIGDRHIGGYLELAELNRRGELDVLLVADPLNKKE